jgi:hypothetical protein
MRAKRAWKDSACLAGCTTAVVLAMTAGPALSAGGGGERGGAMIGRAGSVGAMREMNSSGGFRAGFQPRVVVSHGGFVDLRTPTTITHGSSAQIEQPSASERMPTTMTRGPLTRFQAPSVATHRVLDPVDPTTAVQTPTAVTRGPSTRFQAPSVATHRVLDPVDPSAAVQTPAPMTRGSSVQTQGSSSRFTRRVLDPNGTDNASH